MSGVQEPSRAIRVGKKILGRIVSEIVMVDVGKPQSQHVRRVVDLSEVGHRHIWDGLKQLGQRLSELLTDGHREAA